MKALTALACIPFGSYRRTIVYIIKILMTFSSHVMQSIDMGLCMHVDLYMTFIRAKFQMSPWSNKRAVAVRICHDFDS